MLEEFLRGLVERIQSLSELAARKVFGFQKHELAKCREGRVRHKGHELAGRREGGGLPRAELRAHRLEQVGEQVLHADLDRLAVLGLVRGEPVGLHVEEVEAGRILFGIDEDEAVGESFSRCEDVEALNLAEHAVHVALRIDQHDRGRVILFQVVEDDTFQGLGLAPPGRRIDRLMLGALLDVE